MRNGDKIVERELFEKASIITKKIDTLDILEKLMNRHHLEFSSSCEKVSDSMLDEDTASKIKDAIKKIICEKRFELYREFEAL